MDSTDGTSLISQLVLRERQGRDRGWWSQMRACYDQAAVVDLNWYRGNADGFVDASRRQYDAGRRATHRLSPPVVLIRGSRALTETAVALETRNMVDGVECDLTSYLRLLSRVEHRAGGWRLMTLSAIYERDTLTPVIPGQNPTLDLDLLAAQRPSYRFLAYVQKRIGWPSHDDLPGDDQPDLVATVHNANNSWLTEATANPSPTRTPR
jgi:hypothetical protein